MPARSMSDFSFNSRFANFGSGLLISILLRYPEMGSIRCIQETQVLTMNFLVADKYDFEKLSTKLANALEVFHQIEGRKMKVFEIERSGQGIEKFILTRDLATLTLDEMNLAIEIIKDALGKDLIAEEDLLGEEDMLFQEEMILYTLAAVRSKGAENSLTALREDGQVLVFNS